MKFSATLVALALTIGPAAIAEESLQVIPSEIVLTGSEASHQLLVERIDGGRFVGQAEGEVVWSSSDQKVVAIDNGNLTPLGNGSATIEVKAAGKSAKASVQVVDFDKPHEWSFRNHVLAVFAKSGCNSGACHGALAGKGGFRLTLRGYDPASDYHTIVKQARGRRIEFSDPGRSLILAKPTAALAHKGGLRFDTDSFEYRVISEWITSGAKPPTDNDAQIEKLEVLPGNLQLKVGQKQQLLVRAHYSDGRVEDVTRWTRFGSANETVAKVDNAGTIEVIGNGVGAVTAWFASRIVISQVTSPYPYNVPADVYAKEPQRNFIDKLVLGKLKDLNLRPSPQCSDQEFVRRVYIDTIGTLPTPEETTEFLNDEAASKRDRLIDSLLNRPEFVDYWTYRLSDIFLINGNRLRQKAVKAYYDWLHQQVEKNTPWDDFARQVVTAKGSSIENGATNFYALHQDPENMAENVSQAFLGLSIACAKCHNHPLEKWTNNQYYAFANLFARVRAKGWGGDGRGGDGIRTLYVQQQGELIQPLTGRPQPPTPLDGESLAFEDANDRREHLAKWLTSPDNPYFARAITNRIWKAYLGVGLIEEVDDLRRSNPASHEELLSAAADYLVEKKFNLNELMQAILQSHTYQRSAQPLEENKDESRFYSRYYPKRMMAEVMLDAISQVTEVPTGFTHIAFPGGDRQKTDYYPKGTRAIQLYDSAVESYFLKAFGRNSRDITCECERSDEPSMVQVLHIANGDTINDKLKVKDNRVAKLLASGKSSEELVTEVFLLCLSRQPTDRELKGVAAALDEIPKEDADQRRIVLEDIFWSVMSTREFLFNH